MTLKDVAEKAGVSVSTVSRVIASSNEKCASEEVKKRIWKAVQETGYRPNQSAQALRKGAPGQNECAASICCLFARSKDFASDRYFEELSGYVKQEIMRQGYRLGKQFAQHDAQEVATGNYRPGKRDGLVVMGRTQDALAPLISLFGKRVVYITLNQMHIAADHVMCDGRQATEIAMRYLYSNGHRKIAYIGEYKGEIRYKSYAEFLAQNNLQLQWGIWGRDGDKPHPDDAGAFGTGNPAQTGVGRQMRVHCVQHLRRVVSRGALAIPEGVV